MLTVSQLINSGALGTALAGYGRGLSSSAVAGLLFAEFPDADQSTLAQVADLAQAGRRCGRAITRGGEVGINLAQIPILPVLSPGIMDVFGTVRYKRPSTGKEVIYPVRITRPLPAVPPDQPFRFPSLPELIEDFPPLPQDTLPGRLADWVRKQGLPPFALPDEDMIQTIQIEWAFRGPTQ